MMASSTISPFVDWGKFLPYTTPRVAVKARAELPDGTQANINSFPVNHSVLVVVYPRSDDPVLYQEAFRTWQLIKLPAGLGGEKMVFQHSGCVAWYMPPSLVPVQVQASRRQEERRVSMLRQHLQPDDRQGFRRTCSPVRALSNVLPILYLEVDEQQNL
jgi:rieske iron-sulfur protein